MSLIYVNQIAQSHGGPRRLVRVEIEQFQLANLVTVVSTHQIDELFESVLADDALDVFL